MNELNILIVEDEILIYMHITRTLKNLGIQNIFTARSAQEAIKIASDVKIDILFSDIKIEGEIDGIDTALILQTLYGLPVIFITAHKDKEMLKRVSKIDTIGYLLKPYRPDELETLIELSMEKFDLTQQKELLVYQEYCYDTKTFTLTKDNQIINLSKKEQLFLSLLFTNFNRIVPYETVDKTVWFDGTVSDNTRRTFIYRMKQKLPDINFTQEKNIGIGFLN